MEKITKSTDTVLIDPNEPLILPDGTALVGRIEWFLYALCCLDYQNLPTPMSRIEEFANALITGEIPNIEPQSRAEQFFLAILDGNVSNLPQPQSRSEVLLDKLARGEFDLSDVEPIQSRYELLLAYLIKNGGIGNIDYVLYEFSEAMKTMYNTVEKPFKSLELSGNTLVNCVLEDTENDDYTSFDKDYSGTSFTINGTSEGAIKSAILSGNTLVNIENTLFPKTTGWYDNNGVNSFYRNAEIISMMNPNTDYLLYVEALPTVSQFLSVSGGLFGAKAVNLSNGKAIAKVTTTDVLPSQATNYFKSSVGGNLTQEEKESIKLMIIKYQDGMENWDISYFEGMQSVKMPVLTTTNGSANILIGSQLNDMTGEIETSPYGNKMIEDYILIPNADITMSNAQWLKVFFYDENKVYISNTGGGYIDSYVLNSSTIPTNAKYFRYHYSGSSYPVIKFSDGTDYITPTVGSEPYKTNILTTIGKNLFDMNRPYDAITDSQATVVQDTNQITVSSAESGIYVNANFILDKDFFAGKTVTGSCLYESDEKDIGTVQIHYQDGNGEHHYQWIRTPKTFTFPNSFIGDVMLSVSANNTGTPQSNTVTVKNIQLELGSTATSYEPYSEGVTLRGIGDVQDELNCLMGELTQNIYQITLTGDESGYGYSTAPSVDTDFHGTLNIGSANLPLNKKLVAPISNRFQGALYGANKTWQCCIGGSYALHFFIPKTELETSDINGFKNWVKQQYLNGNPIKVAYILEEKSIKTVDLNVVDQNNTKIDKMHVFNETTHVNASSDGLTPTVNIGKSVSYPTIIKPSTKYTVDLKRNDKPLTVNLGGTEVTFADGETRKIITTPSTLTNDKLSYYGIGAKCNKIMLIEGEVEGNVDYFTGMQSVVMQNQMPILHTVGENLFDISNASYGYIASTGEATTGKNNVKSAYIPIKPNTKYSINAVGSKVENSNFSWYDSNKNFIVRHQVTKTSISPDNAKYLIIHNNYGGAENIEDLTSVTLMLTEGDIAEYKPYKSSILSCNEDVTLCGIGNVKDELDCKTGEVTQRVGKLVLDGSSDEDWRISFGGSDTHTRFIMRRGSNLKPINNVNNQRFLCDKFKCVILISGENSDEVCLMESLDNFFVSIIIDNTRLNSVDVDGFKLWLQSNPIVVQYQLATPTIKTVDLFVVDQDGNTIPKVKSHNGTTHLEVTVPKQSLLPNISAEVATDNSKDMSSLTTKHQEISEAQSAIQNSIQSQSNEIDTAMMATTEIFESILE